MFFGKVESFYLDWCRAVDVVYEHSFVQRIALHRSDSRQNRNAFFFKNGIETKSEQKFRALLVSDDDGDAEMEKTMSFIKIIFIFVCSNDWCI